MKRITKFLVPMLFSCVIILTGCTTTTVYYNYTPDSQFSRDLGNGQQLRVVVKDMRTSIQIARTNTGQSVNLARNLRDLLQDAFEKALRAVNFQVEQGAEVQYYVGIRNCSVSWNGGIYVPVTADVYLEIELRNASGYTFVRQTVREQSMDTAWGGGPPALGVANRVLSDCLTKVVERAVLDPELLSGLSNQLPQYAQKRPYPVTIQGHEKTSKPLHQKFKPLEFRNQMISSQRWAVIIGVSDYQDTRIPALRYAAADTQAFYDWIVSSNGGKHAPSNVRLLIGRDATLASIKRALFNWLKQALEEDVVIIYFAGHGSPESPDYPNNLFLLPYDAKYDDIATTSFPMWDIETALKRFIKAKKIVVFADACHSGGVGQSFDIARRANRGIKINPISSGILNLSQIGDGVCVISASDDKQFSQESQKWGGGHGVFTYFLLRGLNSEADYNNDNHVTLGELIPYLSEQVRRATRNAQSPTVAGRFDPALSIGR